MSPDTSLTELRLSTRAEHDRIEQILQLTEPMSLARYAQVMSGFEAFLRAWEPRVRQALPARLQPWFDGRLRGGFARADVDWLQSVAGVAPPRLEAPAAARLPLGELAQALGSLYVIEGSALGGRVIAPRLAQTLGLAPGRGASYFHGFGDETGALWRDFRTQAALELDGSVQATALACQSAKDTFAALIELFEPLAPAAQPPR